MNTKVSDIMKMRIMLGLFVLVLPAITVYSQIVHEEKRIYLVDVTASMEGKGVGKTYNIFDKVKNELVATIDSIDDSATEVVVVPFTNKVHKTISGILASQKDSLLQEIRQLEVMPGDTDITAAWKHGISLLDSTKVNYLFLLTDGLHNCGGPKEQLYEQLREWNKYSMSKYYFAFYTMLTPNAEESEICRIADETRQMWKIRSMNINAYFLKSPYDIDINTKSGKAFKIFFQINKKMPANGFNEFHFVLEDNPYYHLVGQKNRLDEKYVELELEEKMPIDKMPASFRLNLNIIYDEEQLPLSFFTPDYFSLNVTTTGIRTMTIKAI